MAKCWAYTVNNLQKNDTSGYILSLNLFFIGTEVGNGEEGDTAVISLTGTETTGQLVSKIVDGIVAKGVERGFTVARTDILFPTFTRGS